MDISDEDLLFTSLRKCTVDAFEGAPTYKSLNSLNTHLNTCAASVHSNLGEGILGYLVLTAPPAM